MYTYFGKVGVRRVGNEHDNNEGAVVSAPVQWWRSEGGKGGTYLFQRHVIRHVIVDAKKKK